MRPRCLLRRRAPVRANVRQVRRARVRASTRGPSRPVQQRRLHARSVLRRHSLDSCEEQSVYGGKYLNPHAAAADRVGHAALRTARCRRRRSIAARRTRRCRGSTSTATTARPPRTTIRTATTRGVLANRLNLEWDCWLTSTERFHMFTGPLQRRQRFPTRRVRRRRRRVLRRARFLRRRYRHRVLRRRPRLHARRLDRPLRPFDMPITVGLIPLVFQNGVWMDDAIVGVGGHDPGPQQPAARLVELRRHVLHRLRPGHEPGVREQPGGRQRVRRHHDDRSQGRLHRSSATPSSTTRPIQAAATTTSASRTRGDISTSCRTRCA